MLKVIRQASTFTRQVERTMSSYFGPSTRKQDGRHVIDLRSDTAAHPTPAMKEAMVNAELGDDVFGEDPTVNALNARCAEMFGKEASLLVPSGCMANLIAGLQSNIVPNQSDGSLLLEDIRSRIRPLNDDHQPWTKLICLENTQNRCGGKVLSVEYMSQVRKLAKENNLKVHLDGARIFNAATMLGVPVSDLVKHVDSVSCCFSKGLACPIGSVLMGSKEFIAMAKRTRKALGGGMRQAGILAAPMMTALDTIVPRLHEDHANARTIAQGIMSSQINNIAAVDVDAVETNIVFVDMTGSVSAEQFCSRMSQVPEEERTSMGESIITLMGQFGDRTIRLVTHNGIDDEAVQKTVKKFHYVLNELS